MCDEKEPEDEPTEVNLSEELSENDVESVDDEPEPESIDIIQEINDDDDDDNDSSNVNSEAEEEKAPLTNGIESPEVITDTDEKDDKTIHLDESDDVVVLDDVKENGEELTDNSEEPTVITIDDGDKAEEAIAPRRSTRNANKEKKRYVEVEEEKNRISDDSSSDIEEVLPQDPLGECEPPLHFEKVVKKSRLSSSTIVVKDTKCLAEIASKTSANNNKKEPTLVIIDTNSILSGRGPIPIAQKAAASTPISNSFSMLPMALPAQGIYPANMRATITPIPMSAPSAPKQPPPLPVLPQAPVLPTLTDDMFVVEAPSFIVPYVYEKPPIKDLREFVKNLESEIKSEAKESEGSEAKKEGSSSGDNEKENVSSAEDGDLSMSLMAEFQKSQSSCFESPLGKFFMGIGYSLVQEAVQTDLLKQQKRKRDRENGQNSDTIKTISSLVKNLEYTKENNEPYRMETKKCEFCSFKTESSLAMAFHLETPHMKNYIYRCNFCSYEVRSPHDILFHMELQHGVRGRLERAPAFHQCPNCPFEDNQKGKLSRHSVACARKFKPDRNLEPPADFEPPAKIPRAPRLKQQGLGTAAAVYQAMARSTQYQMMSKMAGNLSVMQRGRGRPTLGSNSSKQVLRPPSGTSMLYKSPSMSGGSVLVPTNYQLSGNQLYQVSALLIVFIITFWKNPQFGFRFVSVTLEMMCVLGGGWTGGGQPYWPDWCDSTSAQFNCRS